MNLLFCEDAIDLEAFDLDAYKDELEFVLDGNLFYFDDAKPFSFLKPKTLSWID